MQKSNLHQHIKAVHFEHKPFACSVPGCDMRFPFKHVRDNHEKSGCHLYTHVSYLTVTASHVFGNSNFNYGKKMSQYLT